MKVIRSRPIIADIPDMFFAGIAAVGGALVLIAGSLAYWAPALRRCFGAGA